MTFTPVIVGTGLTGFAYLQRTGAAQQTTLQNTEQNKRESAQLAEKLPSIQSSEDLMDDRMMLRIALGAFGLDEDINNRAFIKQVLDSDMGDDTSFANRLSDKRYASLARAFGFNTEAGSQVPGTQEASELAQRLESVTSVSDLMGDRGLLRAVLTSYGLPESDADNTYFLEQVFSSDPSDTTSFANSLSDTRYAAMAADLDFTNRGTGDGLLGFVAQAKALSALPQTAEEFLSNRELVTSAVGLFGLDTLVPSDEFLTNVLNSDLEDANSFANTQSDDMWATFAGAFGFGDKLARPGSFAAENTDFERLVADLESKTTPFSEASDVLSLPSTLLAVTNFFDLPNDENGFNRMRLVLESDPSSPTSTLNLMSDPRYKLAFEAIDFRPVQEGWRPAPGFADALMENYLERQFEIRIGEVDPNMRLALGFEREMSELLQNAASNNARWFGIMASEPLRQVFEGALSLPDSFGALDLDRQLVDFTARAEAQFGTSDVAELASKENVDAIVQRFLSSVTFESQNLAATSSSASVLLSSIQAGFNQF